jgi:hypothetical protein
MTTGPQQKISWQESARQVQAVRDRSIKQVDPAIAAFPDTHTGRVIDVPRKHLSQTEIAITESSAETLVASLATGKLTAIAVTNAFLRRAAVAQKLVSNAAGVPAGKCLEFWILTVTNLLRPTVSTNFFLNVPPPAPKNSTITLQSIKSPLVRFMVCQLASKDM